MKVRDCKSSVVGYLRDYLNDLNAGNERGTKIPPNYPGSPKSNFSPRAGKRKLTNLDNYENDDYDLDLGNMRESTNTGRVKYMETMPLLVKS